MKASIDFDLLQKLADHLNKGELLHDEFDFETYNGGYNGVRAIKEYKGKKIHNCGTRGCAIGELPAIDDSRFYFSKTGGVMDRNINGGTKITEGANPFNLRVAQYHHLFVDDWQNVIEYGGAVLDAFATKEQVANNIQIFIDKFKPNEN